MPKKELLINLINKKIFYITVFSKIPFLVTGYKNANVNIKK